MQTLNRAAQQRGFGQLAGRPSYDVRNTNLNHAIHKVHGIVRPSLVDPIDVVNDFRYPRTLPWKNVMVILDTGVLSYARAVCDSQFMQGIQYDLSITLEEYTAADPIGQPRLYIIEDSLTPEPDTIGLSAAEMLECRHGHDFLGLRGYLIACYVRSLYRAPSFDQNTKTVFPMIRDAQGLKAARSSLVPGCRKRFLIDAVSADEPDESTGARLIVECEYLK